MAAIKRFSFNDQERFAAFSGDFNPMHLDAVFARKTQAGEPVVHGMHLLLWALEHAVTLGYPIGQLSALKGQFIKFVSLDQDVRLELSSTVPSEAKLRIVSGPTAIAKFTLTFGARGPASDGGVHQVGEILRAANEPRDLPFDAMVHQAGWLTPPAGHERAATIFPLLSREIGEPRVEALAALSTLVGMICPGLHSIFSSFELALPENIGVRSGIGFSCTSADDRFGMVRLAIDGSGISGAIVAFARQPPTQPPTLLELSDKISQNEFDGVQALIIGGSRGLGAATAKVIAAGGGKVAITFAHGAEEADAVVSEIVEARGGDVAAAMQLDLTGEWLQELASAGNAFNQVYYFATPKIFRQSMEKFSVALLDEFMAFYVRHFFDICVAVAKQCEGSQLAVFYPSSEAVVTRPRGMTEYAMAKAAGEILCEDLPKVIPSLRILSARLPRMMTDQTATVAPVEAQSAADGMLPHIRSMMKLVNAS